MSVNNLESHIAESLLEYLLNIIQDDEIGNMSKLASLTVLNKLFKSDSDNSLKYKCIQADLVCSILMALDTGLSPNCHLADTVYVLVAMEIMWQLSKMPIGQLQSVISESVIRSLLTYLDVDGEFYRFSCNMRKHTKALCENKHLIGRVRKVPMSTEPLEYIHKHTQNQLKRLVKLPDTVLVCELYDTGTSDADLNITQSVLKEKLAWPGCIPGTVSKDSSADSWQDVIVTEMKDGGIFWAHIGEEAMKRVADIQAVLNKGGLERMDRVVKGESVVVFGKIHDTPCYLRAQVLKVKESATEVFALDYGCTLSVVKSEIYTLPEDLELSVCPQCASLCSILGIQAPPFDEDLVSHACAILANFCKQSRSAGEILEKLGGVEIVDKLLQKCQGTKILTQAVILVNNLCCNANMSPRMIETDILQSVLDAVSNDIENETRDCHLLTSCLSCLINLVHNNPRHRQLFYQKQGIDVALKVVCHSSRSSPLYLVAAKLLKVFVGNAAILADKKNVPSSISTSPHKRDERSQHSSQNSAVAERLVSRRRNQTKFEDLRNNIASVGEVSTERPEGHSCHSKLSKVEKHYPTDSSDDETLYDSSSTLQDSGKDEKYYIRDSRVKFDDDLTHEIRPNKEVFTISHMSIAPHVCGMLNSGHGGVIYFGIGKDKKVFGLEMNREDRDEFRLGIDRLMHRKITPILLHSHFDVKLIPVLDPDQHSILTDLYVVEISVTGAGDTQYASDDSCFYRFGSATSPVTPMELRQLVVLEVEEEFKVKLVRLKHERDRLKKSKQLEGNTVSRVRQDTSSES